MDNGYTIRPIGYIRSDYNEKFGVPRQPGLVTELEQAVVIDPLFSNIDALRGLEGFTHVWLIWGFSENASDMEEEPLKWFPTVRPPRLGGRERVGVWATRSPYRPNSLGLSSVRLVRIELDGKPLDEGASGETTGELASGKTTGELALIVSGADMVNGTPVYDIKPYIPYSDSHPEASGGFTGRAHHGRLTVEISDELLEQIDEPRRAGLVQMLELDPRGAYEKKTGYTYGLSFGDWDIRFTVEEDTLRVTEIVERSLRAAKVKE